MEDQGMYGIILFHLNVFALRGKKLDLTRLKRKKTDCPTTWYSKYPSARGSRQSPINIEINKVVQDRQFMFRSPLSFNYHTSQKQILKNTGASWQVNVEGSGSARKLVSHLPQETRNVKSDAQMTIVDFMALVRKLPMKKMGLHTFEELAKSLSDRILATGSVSTRIDIIFDVYQKSSIKQMERAQRSSSEEITITIRSDNQKLPVKL
ncbi:hypothetical protein GQR58_014932 [Nymphon striatum]|nr:hypothetical protein GQR58_014932 [Nymphon striatum]